MRSASGRPPAVPLLSLLAPSPSAGDGLPPSPYITTAYQPPPSACPPASLLPVPPPLANPPLASSSSPAGSPWLPRDAVCRVCAEAAVNDDVSETEGEAVADPEPQEGRDARRPRPLPGARAGPRGQGRQQWRKLPAAADGDAGLGALLANDDVEIIVGRGRWGGSWHKIVILNDYGLPFGFLRSVPFFKLISKF